MHADLTVSESVMEADEGVHDQTIHMGNDEDFMHVVS